MSEVTLATLAMEVSVPTADAAIDKLKKLRAAASELEGQAGKTATASKEQASAHGYMGTAAAQAEKTMRGLVEVYGTAYNASGRYVHSVEAEVSMILQNAKATAALAREQQAAAAQVARLTASYDPLAGAVMRTNNEIAKADALFKSGKLSAEQYATIVGGLKGKIDLLESAQTGLNKTGNTLRYTTLNLGRQFADIGTQLAGGQSPFLILVQQGPQIADAFATATAGGLTFKAVIAGLVTEAKALLLTFGPWIAGLAAVGGAVWYLVDAHNKQKKAIEDLNAQLTKQRDELSQISPFLFQTGDNANLAAEGQRNFDQWLRKTNVSLAEQNRLLRENALNELNKKAIDAAEKLRLAQEQFDKVNKPGPRMASAGGPGGFGVVAPVQSTDPKNNPFWKEAKANLDMAKASSQAISQYLAKMAQAPDAAFASGSDRAAKAVRSVKLATEEYLRVAPIQESSLLKAANEVWPEAAAAAEAYKRQQDALKAAANDNIRTFDEQTRGTIRFSSTLEKMAYDLEDAAAMSRGLRYDIQDIAYAINNNDWTSAFAGLSRVLLQVKAAFEQGAASAQKYAAAAAVAGAVGGAIGGTTGATISGAASGAMTGFTLAGPAGAVVGGILGGLGGLFGSSKAKKQAKRQAEAQRAAEEAQRIANVAAEAEGLRMALLEAEGKTVELTEAKHKAYIASLAAENQALGEQVWQAQQAAEAAARAQDLANQRRSLEIQLMEATGDAAGALAAKRADELAATDETLRSLQSQIYAAQDATKANEAAQDATKGYLDYLAKIDEASQQATAAQQQVADVMGGLASASERVADALKDTMRSLTDFADSLKAELGLSTTGGALDQARKAFNAAVSSGNYAAIPQLGQAYAEAAKSGAGSEAEYRRILAQIRLASLNSVTSAQSDAYQQQLSYSLMGAWFTGNDDLAMQIQRQRAAGLPGFDSGGSFMIGGNPGVDQNLVSVNGVPAAWVSRGEIMGVKNGSANDNGPGTAELIAEMRIMNARLAKIERSTSDTRDLIDQVSEGGNAVKTEAAS